MHGVFETVFICTANRARSPLAELIVQKFAGGLPIAVSSAGLMSTVGAPALTGAVRGGRALGIDLSQHRSKHFSSLDLTRADLVIGFEKEHVAAAIVEGDAPAAKSFELRELVELVGLLAAVEPVDGGDPVERAGRTIEAAHRLRLEQAFVPYQGMGDPVGRPQAFFDRTASEIEGACRLIIAKLFPPGRPRDPPSPPATTPGSKVG